ncbi:MAG: helix-turn-helix domain-containing protein [Bacteroidota bacterium]
MQEKFIERGTAFPLRNGKLTIYETNCACKDIQFYFDEFVMTLMLSGHKTITSQNLKFEFFPGTFFIPEQETINHVSIPNASYYNPTKCLVLELNPSFIQSVYEDIFYSSTDKELVFSPTLDSSKPYFLSNDELLLQAFIKLYHVQSKDDSPVKALVEDLVIREMLLRVFHTEGLHLLKRNFEKSIFDKGIRRVISHIKSHINQKLTTSSLAKIAGLGQTTFFKVFKEATGRTPVDYILQERIRQAKILIQKGKYPLQEVAFRCGFNSYEYFCSSFKRSEQIKPSHFRRQFAS